MKITILGYEDKTYTKEDTGEVKEGIVLYYAKENKSENAVGSACGSEYITSRAFPQQFKEIINAGTKIIGRCANVSKDVRTFNGKSYTVVDEFELI